MKFTAAAAFLVAALILPTASMPRAVLKCLGLARKCDFKIDEIVRNLKNGADIDTMCNSMINTSNCLGDCFGTFMHMLEHQHAPLNSFKYVCNSEIRERVKHISQLPCFNDMPLVSDLFRETFLCQSRAGSCLNATETEVGRDKHGCCMLLDSITKCIGKQSLEHCGGDKEQLETFVIDLMRVMQRSYPVNNLSGEHPETCLESLNTTQFSDHDHTSSTHYTPRVGHNRSKFTGFLIHLMKLNEFSLQRLGFIQNQNHPPNHQQTSMVS